MYFMLITETIWNLILLFEPNPYVSSACVNAKSLQSCPTLCNPWAIAHQAPLSLGFTRQKYWSGFPHPPPRDLPNPETEPASLMLLALAGGFFATSAAWKAHVSSMTK